MNRPPLAEQKSTLLDFARRNAPKPMLVGPASFYLGWWATLNEVENLCELMVREGVLRLASRAELAQWGVRHGYLPV
jgi:hypothetical protein